MVNNCNNEIGIGGMCLLGMALCAFGSWWGMILMWIIAWNRGATDDETGRIRINIFVELGQDIAAISLSFLFLILCLIISLFTDSISTLRMIITVSALFGVIIGLVYSIRAVDQQWRSDFLLPYSTIGLGHYHTCGILIDTTLRCWGDNWNGILGDNQITNLTRVTPKTINILPLTDKEEEEGHSLMGQNYPTQLAVGPHKTCIVMSDSSLICTEYDHDEHKYKLMSKFMHEEVRYVDVGGLIEEEELVFGAYIEDLSHSCIITVGNVLKCWGYNAYGQVGNGRISQENQYRPVAIDLLGGGHSEMINQTSTSSSSCYKVALGSYHTCAITLDDHLLKCWGFNKHGQIGDGTFAPRHKPTSIDIGLFEHATDIALGQYHSCAITNATVNNLKCWGYNRFGQVGDGTTIRKNIPTTLTSVGITIQVALGYHHTCAIMGDDVLNMDKYLSLVLKCWGSNRSGQLGDGTKINRHDPVMIFMNKSNHHAVLINLGAYHSCAILDDDSLWCWGGNDFGQLGDGTLISPRLIPRVI